MKRYLIFIAGFITVGFLYADTDVMFPGPSKMPTPTAISTTPVVVPVTSTQPIPLQSFENRAFNVGEKLEFLIKYEFVGAGTASMEVSEGPVMHGRPTFHIESKANSSKMVDKFFKVRDFNATCMDKAAMISWNFHQNLKEGGYSVIRNTSLDYTTRTFKFQRVRRGNLTERGGPINQPLHDILSCFFYARTLPLELGKEYKITVFSDEEVYPLVIKVHPKIQKISVPAGKFECIRIDPFILGDGIFKAKDGKMSIWLTNDNRKMPVLIRSRVFIGAFDAELQKYTSAGTPFDTVDAK